MKKNDEKMLGGCGVTLLARPLFQTSERSAAEGKSLAEMRASLNISGSKKISNGFFEEGTLTK